MLSPVAAREAVHLLVLRELTRVCGVDSATVKGGVNLRLFFGSVRYSEDIDLDGAATSSDAIRSCIKRIFRDRAFTRTLQSIGIRGLDPGEGPNKDTETTFRYKFGVIVPGGVRYPTKVEVSFRDRHPGDRSVVERPGEGLLAPYRIDHFTVRRYVREAAVRQKVDALGGRREAQARDVFDLHVLARGNPGEDMVGFLAVVLPRERLVEAGERAYAITFKEYEGQVVEFLDPDSRQRYGTESAWDELRLDAASLIESVLRRQEEGA